MRPGLVVVECGIEERDAGLTARLDERIEYRGLTVGLIVPVTVLPGLYVLASEWDASLNTDR
jgi:hypothetical protein